MLKNLLPIIASFFLLNACSDNSKTEVDISQFNMDNSALTNGESVTIISTPGFILGKDEDYSHYYCLNAVSDSTGDTINILVFPSYALMTKEDNNRNFISSESMEYRFFLTVDDKIPSEDQIPKPSKVKVRSDVDFAFYKQYPTVIGLLGSKENSIPPAL